MRIERDPRQRMTLLIGLFIVLASLMLVCGCTQQPVVTPTPTPTPVVTPTQVTGKEVPMYNESANGSRINVTLGGETFGIKLNENPTTGYSWNATVTPGLIVVSDGYEPNPETVGMMGAGGTHNWILRSGNETGEQQFSAIYMRPWENVTGTEQTFVLFVTVEKV
ncbi:MAG: protease inhibitor I42 family protein [Methanoregulaceae archaeon]|nr:protease inhibitor I42 family protein [Methanoregulaceae archaeon]